jgi:hypothetical protein
MDGNSRTLVPKIVSTFGPLTQLAVTFKGRIMDGMNIKKKATCFGTTNVVVSHGSVIKGPSEDTIQYNSTYGGRADQPLSPRCDDPAVVRPRDITAHKVSCLRSLLQLTSANHESKHLNLTTTSTF